MKFSVTINNLDYTFLFLNNSYVLVSSSKEEYILYRNNEWQCADDIPATLLKNLSKAIENHLRAHPVSS